MTAPAVLKAKIKNMNKINYQKKLDDLISELNGRRPHLLLHSCCAPCSSYCIEYLARHFDITVLYYNPNISPAEEFYKRADEEERFIREFDTAREFGVKLIKDKYEPTVFYDAVRGMENIPEGGERCFVCYRLRLRRAAEYANANGFEFFGTTLSVSPLKNSEKLNDIGHELEHEFDVRYLPSDFKKRGGYLRSIELSRKYGLYRQNFCGCVYSKSNAKRREISHKHDNLKTTDITKTDI